MFRSILSSAKRPLAELFAVLRTTRTRCMPGTTQSFLLFLLLPFLLAPFAASSPLQQTPVPANSGIPMAAPAAVPPISESLRPVLQQAGSAVGQINVDRWKLSREWKRQLQGDAGSIQQDISSQLPGLLQAAQASPATLGPQLRLMHNVDALYDVLVRVTTAANIAGEKNDAALLGDALQNLESARKAAADQLLSAASRQDGELAKFQAQLNTAGKTDSATGEHPKTIVVNNELTHSKRRHKTIQHKKAPATPPTPQANNR